MDGYPRVGPTKSPKKMGDSGLAETAWGLSYLRRMKLPGQPQGLRPLPPFAKGDFDPATGCNRMDYS